MADQTPAVLQQNLQSSEKSQHFEENTIFNEHPVYQGELLCNFPMNSHVRRLYGWLFGRSVGLS